MHHNKRLSAERANEKKSENVLKHKCEQCLSGTYCVDKFFFDHRQFSSRHCVISFTFCNKMFALLLKKIQIYFYCIHCMGLTPRIIRAQQRHKATKP